MCAECERAYQDGLKPEIDCATCQTVVLAPENRFAWRIIGDISPLLFRPGGVDPGAIEMGFRVHQVEPWQERDLMEKILAYAEEAIEAAKS